MKRRIFAILVILGLTSICQATSNPTDAGTETNRIKAVVAKCADLMSKNQLPGLSPNDHGNIHGYQLTEAMKKALVDEGLISGTMLVDVKGYSDPYLIGMVTVDGRNFAYFFIAENSNVRLVSSYRAETNTWVKIAPRRN
jgi:hypothetical protein